MKIVIDKVLDENIYFSTDYGMAKGIWKGTNRPIQKEYYVELDIDGLYSYDNVFVNNTKEYQMRILDGKNQLTLLLLEYDEDGCATFQLGDSIIEIETAYDERFYALKNSFIMLFAEKLNVYDENLQVDNNGLIMYLLKDIRNQTEQ